MAKRKTVAGGYEESSDGSDVELVDASEQALKRSKSVPHALPRLTTASKSGLGAFQFPGSRSSSGRGSAPPRHVSVSSSGRPTPSPEGVQTVTHTPKIRVSPDPDPEQRNISSAITEDALSSGQVDHPAGSHKASGQRSSLALERQINQMLDTLEKHISASEQQQKVNDNTLSQIFTTLERLTSANSPTIAQTLGLSPSTSPAPQGSKPYLSNPTPTPELISVVSKVVSEARGRVGKKKGGPDDNSCKEHVRTSFYRMLGIAASKEIRPFFEDEYGEPDTLPVQFIDPDTHYCRPYPHWKSPLTKQVAWIPTFLLRFRSTIPKDQSDLSNVLRNLSDEQIITLLNDGPFKSAQTAWRDLKRTDTEIDVMRSSARRYQRVDRKVTSRTAYIKTIASLQGPQWEYLAHPGYTSQDESDNEGGMVTRRPDHRAQWESNLYDAILVAEREKARAKHGFCPRLPRRRIEIIKCSIPTLEHGSGSGRVPIRIAACGVSKSWRHKNPDEFKKYAHLIDMRETDKPDIGLFLEQYPESNLHELGDDQDRTGGARIGVEGDKVGVCTNGDGDGHSDGWPIVNYDGDEESGAILDMVDLLPKNPAAGADDKHKVSGTTSNDDFPIDPALTDSSTGNPGVQLGPRIPSLPTSDQGVLRSPYIAGIAPSEGYPLARSPQQLVVGLSCAEQSLTHHSLVADMPPPPPLDDLSSSMGNAADNVVLLVDGEKKLCSGKGDSAGNLPPGASNGAAAPTAKRRGRPRGSKNKPKVA